MSNNTNPRITEIALEIEKLSNELKQLLTLQESDWEESTSQIDQTPPVTAFLIQNENPPLTVGDAV